MPTLTTLSAINFLTKLEKDFFTSLSPEISVKMSLKAPYKARVTKALKGVLTPQGVLGMLFSQINELQLQQEPALSDMDRAKLYNCVINRLKEKLLNENELPSLINTMMADNLDKLPPITLSDEYLERFKTDIAMEIGHIQNHKVERKIKRAAEKLVRMQDDEDRKLCRFDSLAELLELSNNHSVCAALTIVDNKLIVSANNSGRIISKPADQSDTDVIANLLNEKMKLLRQFFSSKRDIVVDAYHDSMDLEEYYTRSIASITTDPELDELIFQLQALSASEHLFLVLKQALIKLIKTLLIDAGPFSAAEKNIFFENKSYTILLPKKQSGGDGGSIFSMETYTITEMPPFGVTSYPLGNFPSFIKVNNLHAEQLILLHLKTQSINFTDPMQLIRVGISKLCCVDCHHVFMANPQFKTRGTSGVPFPSTANIEKRTGRAPDGTPERHHGRVCVKNASPLFTPGQPRNKRDRDDSSSSSNISSFPLLGLFAPEQEKKMLKLNGVLENDNTSDISMENLFL